MDRQSRPGERMKRIGVAVAAIVTTAACGDSPAGARIDGSFARLQNEVFAPSCATSACHAGAGVATSGGLSLEGANAYDNLVGGQATNPAARQAGIRRVIAFKPDSSLLYLKLLANDPAHASLDLGNKMPAGGQPLSAGQLEFVLQWIAAGAPRTGEVADARLLDDQTSQTSAIFQPLVAPAAGEGYQMRVEPFVVKPNFERELFVYRTLDNASDAFVKRIQFRMRPFSHHFVAYTFSPTTPTNMYPAPNVVRDIRNADGSLNFSNVAPMAYHIFFGGSMQTEFTYDFPPGVALQLPPNASLDLNLHYANHTNAPVTGEAYLNLYTTDPAAVVHAARTLNLSNFGISLPPSQRTTLEKTFTMSQRTTIVALTSHMHRMGERFTIKIVGGARDGQTVYENTDWEHPALVFFSQPIVLEAGEGLKSVITWNNTTSQAISFGLQSTDEMGIIFGYYY